MSSNGTAGMEVVVKEPAYTDGNTPSPPDMTAPASQLTTFIDRYKSDPESVYNTWYAGSEARMKAFRAIRRGVKDVVSSIAAGTFGNDFKGSPLEVVLTAITEQKQVFEGAAHPFYWKPKLRIPDIYENETNKKAFGLFLNACLNATKEEQVLSEMSKLAALTIKGLGPAVASIVYFLHPTLVPPFNTAIVNGFNALYGAKLKLGSWESYFAMRETMLRTNEQHRALLSKDLGALAGLLFEIGSNRLVVDGNAEQTLQEVQEKAAKAAKKRHQQAMEDQREASEHTQAQHVLIRIGRALGYDVFVARNDRSRTCHGDSFAMLTLPALPALNLPPDVQSTVELIDVLWFAKGEPKLVGPWQTTFAWGQNHKVTPDESKRLPGWLLESTLVARDKHTVFGRFEQVRDDELFQDGAPLAGATFRIRKLSIGYIYDFVKTGPVAWGVGGLVGLYGAPSTLDSIYGKHPKSTMVFLQGRL